MITVQQINEIVTPKLMGSNNFVVDINVKPGNKITILLDSNKGISIEDCVEISRLVEFSLNRDIEDFELSVMSAGLTEPFKILRQYQKNTGKEVEVLTSDGKKINGKLLSATEQGVKIEAKTREKAEGKKKKQQITRIIDLTFSQIKTTKLILLF